jgi:RNA polymerase sigma factor (sigma-70 family)
LLPWLLRIETREAFRLKRRLRRVVRLGWQRPPERANAEDTPGSLEVRDALRRLPPRIRAAVVLHHMTGLSVAQSAEALGVSENTVKTQLKRGLALLREDLGHGR